MGLLLSNVLFSAKTESDIARKEIFTRDNSPIRGLRTDTDLYRSRSAPPKQRLGQVLTSDSGLKVRVALLDVMQFLILFLYSTESIEMNRHLIQF